MKCDKYYDITCIKCGRSLSTDFESGMTRTARQAHLIAKEVGFNSRGICPICIKEWEAEDDNIINRPRN